MFSNYIKLAVRNLMKHKTYSLINILGLTIGLVCCMLISLYIYYENSYDTYHIDGERIYQLDERSGPVGETELRSTVPAAMAGAIKKDFPEIEETTRLLSLFEDDKTLFKYESPGEPSKSFYEKDGYIADASFFNVFTYNFLEGNPQLALTRPNTVVIAEGIAKKIFGNDPAVGKEIKISSSTNGDHQYTITGVFRPNKNPSHINARFFLSVEGGNMENFVNNSTTLMNNNMFFTYIRLKEGSDPQRLEQKFPSFIEQHLGGELKARGSKMDLFLTPLRAIHLESDIAKNVTPPGSKKYIYILASIAILTLLIACINFMNLSTARSSKRSVEVGVRKVLGAERKMLIWQFLGESLVMSLIAYILALAIVQFLLPVFVQVAGKKIVLDLGQQVKLYLAFLLIAVLTGLLAGSYPAFFLSSFKPVKVLKGKFSNSFAALSLRRGLVIIQFVISVILIIASLVISKQMNFLRSTDLGFQKDHQLIIPLRSSVAKGNYLNLKRKIEAMPNVSSAGASFYYPGIFNPTDWLMYKEGKSMEDATTVYINRIDNSFLQTLEIQPIAGRLFSAGFTGDNANSVIINEKAVSQIGFPSPEEAIGHWIAFDWEGEQNRFIIVGVVKDFHFKDLHVGIEPYAFLLNNTATQNYITVHLDSENLKQDLVSFEEIWKSQIPNEPFEYSFLDQDFQKNYEAEDRLDMMIGYFTLIAIIISCLGLFGLATFSAEQQIREIGVRKVLGASVSNLVALLSFDFLKLVLLAILIASPLAWYAMDKWLQTFAYKINMPWQVFVLATLLTVLIALGTISFQALKAALTNPVKSLRSE